ncbi:MAG: iron ABC transporter permease [Rhodobacteraceae bacterium]|nr:iron ABC transporter permease [Paracoccaceae bacterium]
MKRLILTLAALLLPLCYALAQSDEGGRGYAGLSADIKGYSLPSRDVPLAFPRDLGPHPDFRIEWWYLTANLEGEDGTVYGVQWTLFRQALAPPDPNAPPRQGWSSSQFWMAHAALTTPDQHFFAERFARGGVGQAGVDVRPTPKAPLLSAWIDQWALEADAPAGAATPTAYRVSADGPGFALALNLETEHPFALQGEEGYSVKSDDGHASYYYSQPFLEGAGTLTVNGSNFPVRGKAWLDREWSSQPLAPDQEGWDWFSLHLDSDEKVMLFRLRHTGGGHFYSGNWIMPDGASAPLKGDDIEMIPGGLTNVAGRELPTSWRLRIPSRKLDLTAKPVNAQAWNGTSFAYWEGPVRLSGSHAGVGYLEMTGYE